MAKPKKGRQKKSGKGRTGTPYERVVAAVAREMDPSASVDQGEWVRGPDGARELDVVIRGTVDGAPRTVLIECKDYSLKRPVGIAVVDAFESKARDLDVDVAIICSNAGFASPAVRKATRKNIGLIGVMKLGDSRIRFRISELAYTRRIKIERLDVTLSLGDAVGEPNGAPLESIRYGEGLFGAWLVERIGLWLVQNPVVNGHWKGNYRLKEPIDLEMPNGPRTIDTIAFSITIIGGWYAHEATYDATAGFYDWLRSESGWRPGRDNWLSKESTCAAVNQSISRLRTYWSRVRCCRVTSRSACSFSRAYRRISGRSPISLRSSNRKTSTRCSTRSLSSSRPPSSSSSGAGRRSERRAAIRTPRR